MVRLLIVSDIRLYREGLARVLAADGRVEVIGATASVEEALATHAGWHPEVVLLDAGSAAALAAACAISESFPDTKVVALGVANAEGDVIACAEAGVAGYVLREGSVEDLVATVESAARGELRCSPRIAGALMQRLARLAGDRPGLDGARLTRRELEIVRMIDDGLTNKEIAARLRIEVATVKNHVHNLIEKLGVRRRGEAAAKMRRRPRPSDSGVV
jgi:DNA-binding NarL/FixJ family response regulator